MTNATTSRSWSHCGRRIYINYSKASWHCTTAQLCAMTHSSRWWIQPKTCFIWQLMWLRVLNKDEFPEKSFWLNSSHIWAVSCSNRKRRNKCLGLHLELFTQHRLRSQNCTNQSLIHSVATWSTSRWGISMSSCHQNASTSAHKLHKELKWQQLRLVNAHGLHLALSSASTHFHICPIVNKSHRTLQASEYETVDTKEISRTYVHIRGSLYDRCCHLCGRYQRWHLCSLWRNIKDPHSWYF